MKIKSNYVLNLSLDIVIFFVFQRAKQLTAEKEAGNAAFRSGHLQEAFDLYSKALEIDPRNVSTNSKLYCNRATVGAKVITYI